MACPRDAVPPQARSGSGTRRRAGAILAALCAVIQSLPCAAEPPGELRYDFTTDAVVTVTGALAWGASELLKGDLVPADCRWCDRHPDGSDALNGVDATVRDALRWSSVGTADLASDATAFALAPLASLGMDALAAVHDDRPGGFAVDGLLIVEAAVLAGGFTQAVKFSSARERPFVHFRSRDGGQGRTGSADDNTSFPSGHTTLAFALASSSGTVASMRGYRLAPWVWTAGLAAAAATGYLRVAADQHYLTDVLAGAAVGVGIGFAVPYLFHRPVPAGPIGNPTVMATPLPGGAAVTLAWRW